MWLPGFSIPVPDPLHMSLMFQMVDESMSSLHFKQNAQGTEQIVHVLLKRPVVLTLHRQVA